MFKLKKKEYDVIIIGAGIGGLVCGCYLAKDGMKVLIIEKNNKAGGYCSSFKINNFTFDTAVSSLVGLGDNGLLRNIFAELNLDSKLKFKRVNPSHIIILPDYRVKIMNNFQETGQILKTQFPKEEKNIRNFIDFIGNPNFLSILSKIKNMTFKELLDSYFKDFKLKVFWNMLRANTGIAPSISSALADILLCRGYIFDGGYYPEGGMQNLADNIVEQYQKNGGELIFAEKVNKIVIKASEVQGVKLSDNTYYKSKRVVSCCDAMQTFSKLVGKDRLAAPFIRKISRVITSPSAFIVYLGINKDLKRVLGPCTAMWGVENYPIDKEYNLVFNSPNIKYSLTNIKYISFFFPSFHNENFAPEGKTSMCILIGAPFKNKKYWQKNKNIISDLLIKKADKFITNVSKEIIVKSVATPFSLYASTLNYKGSSRGWATSLTQTSSPFIFSDIKINGLFLAGHWTTLRSGGSVTMSSYSGRTTAMAILRKKGGKNK